MLCSTTMYRTSSSAERPFGVAHLSKLTGRCTSNMRWSLIKREYLPGVAPSPIWQQVPSLAHSAVHPSALLLFHPSASEDDVKAYAKSDPYVTGTCLGLLASSISHRSWPGEPLECSGVERSRHGLPWVTPHSLPSSAFTC